MDRSRQSDYGMRAFRFGIAFWVLVAAAIFVAGCATVGTGRPTEFRDDLTSACLDSRSSYKAYENFCIIKKGKCPTAQKTEANALRSQAAQLCATGNEAHKMKVQAIVKQQEALGR